MPMPLPITRPAFLVLLRVVGTAVGTAAVLATGALLAGAALAG